MKRLPTYLEIGNACDWGVTRSQYHGLPRGLRRMIEEELRAHIASLPDPQAAPSGLRYSVAGLLERQELPMLVERNEG